MITLARHLQHALTGHHAGECMTIRGDGHGYCCCGKRITERTWVDFCARNRWHAKAPL